MIITRTPLRVSFVGGGTDFRDFYHKEVGEVISTTIDKYVYVILKERYDSQICVNYSKREIVQNIDQIEHELIREAMRKTAITCGIEITTLADIPVHGSGLGSSSCLTVGVLNALYVYQGIQKTAENLAREACEIEIDILGKPIGKQDQYICAYGGLRHIQFRADESVVVETVDIDEDMKRVLNANTLLFYTGIERQSTDILTEQKRNIRDNFKDLYKLKSLVHQFKMTLVNPRVIFSDFRRSSRDSEAFGDLLHRNWELKQNLASKISNAQINKIYDLALESGAQGGKLLGAGGGGFFLFCAPPEKHGAIRKRLSELQEFAFNLECNGSQVIFNIRR